MTRTPEPDDGSAGDDGTARRRYDSPVRRAQASKTRERIVAAGAGLVHESPRWDWRHITVRAVADRAAVNTRTVYRYFASERDLHDAIVRRLEEEAGEPMEGLGLDELPDVTARVFSFLSSFALRSHESRNPTLVAVDDRRRQALQAAIDREVGSWTDVDRTTAAAMLDALWTVNTYDRLTAVWGLDAEQASRAVAGVVRLVVDAIRDGEEPWFSR